MNSAKWLHFFSEKCLLSMVHGDVRVSAIVIRSNAILHQTDIFSYYVIFNFQRPGFSLLSSTRRMACFLSRIFHVSIAVGLK